MRSLLLVTILVFAGMNAGAQLRLTQSDYQKFYGASCVENYTATPAGELRIDAGAAGMNNVFDFSNISFEKEDTQCHYLNPSETPFAGSFPYATKALCRETKNCSSVVFYRLESEGLFVLGNASIIDGMSVVYSSNLNRMIVKFPLQLATHWEFEGKPESPSPGVTTQLIADYTVDAAGTLKLGFLENASIRLKIVEETIREQTVMGTYSRSVQRSVTYQFITETGTIVTAVIDTLDEGLENPRVLSLEYIAHVFDPIAVPTTGPPESLEIVASYPNPVSGNGMVSVVWSTELQEHVSLSLYDVAGRERMPIFDGVAQPGTAVAQVDVSRIPAGMYFLRLRNGDATRVRMISVL